MYRSNYPHSILTLPSAVKKGKLLCCNVDSEKVRETGTTKYEALPIIIVLLLPSDKLQPVLPSMNMHRSGCIGCEGDWNVSGDKKQIGHSETMLMPFLNHTCPYLQSFTILHLGCRKSK